MTAAVSKNIVTIEDPAIARFLFSDVRFSWFWLILRLYTGYQWAYAGYEKLIGGWVGDKAGVALGGFIGGALKQVGGEHPSVQGWYAWFLQTFVQSALPLWSYFITFGEILVGLGLIFCIFTGLAAFFGGMMNVNYLLAGTVSTNPFLFVFATWLVLAWKTAGWLGGDRWVLPMMGQFAPKIFNSSKKS